MATQPTADTPPALPADRLPPSVLVIEDDTITARLLEISLARRCGAFVRTVGSAEAALPLIREIDWDLVFVDIGLPNANGLDLMAFSKRLLPQTPHIVVTSRTGDDDLLAAARAGADDYLVKPVRMDGLLRAVEQALCGRLDPERSLAEVAA